MKLIFKSQYQYEVTESSFEPTSELDSETIPEQSLSVNEVIQRFQNGTLDDIAKQPIFDNYDDFDAYDITLLPDFDIVDAHQMLDEIYNKRNTLLEEKAQTINNKKSEETEQSEANETPTNGK